MIITKTLVVVIKRTVFSVRKELNLCIIFTRHSGLVLCDFPWTRSTHRVRTEMRLYTVCFSATFLTLSKLHHMQPLW
jgi:hypothetical protein